MPRSKRDLKLDKAVDMTFPASDFPAAGSETSTEPAKRPVDRKPPVISASKSKPHSATKAIAICRNAPAIAEKSTMAWPKMAYTMPTRLRRR